MHGWVLPPKLFPLPTMVSQSAAQRVERLMAAHWDLRRAGYIAAEQRSSTAAAGLIPDAREIEAKVRDLVGEDHTAAAVAIQVAPFPPPTAEMMERVELRVTHEIEEWRTECHRLVGLAKTKRAALDQVNPQPTN